MPKRFLRRSWKNCTRPFCFMRTAGQLDGSGERFAGYSAERFLFYLKDRLDAASLKAVLEALKEETGEGADCRQA